MVTGIAIRRFRWADLGRILEIERASFGPDAYDRNLFAAFFRRCGELFLVAVRDGQVLGYMVTAWPGQEPGQRAELVSVATDPAFRGQGAAAALMRSAVRRLRLRGTGWVTLSVRTSNATARRFYERYGFTKMRRLPGYYEDGEDGILMRKLL